MDLYLTTLRRDSIVDTVIGLRTRRSGVQIPAEVRYISPQGSDRLWGSSRFIFNGWALSRGCTDRDVYLTTTLHQLPRLRKGGPINLFPLYTFIMWTGTTPFIYVSFQKFCTLHVFSLKTNLFYKIHL